MIDEILRDFEDPMSIHVIAMGKVGVGKSTLLNGLIGYNLFKTGNSIFPVTRQLEKKIVVKNGVYITICDPPGLANVDLEDDDTLQYALQECGEIDLFLFCNSMTDRIGRMHIEEMKAITDIFGRDIWKKALFVLTFANEYRPDQKEQFVDKVEVRTQELKKIISKIIGPELGNKVPVIPAGHEAPNLPDRASWISELWIQGFRRMGFRAMVKLYIISQERLHSNTEEIKLSQETPENQPLIACHMTIEKRKNVISENEMRIAGLIVGEIVSRTILGKWITVGLFRYFGWNDDKEKEIVDCHEEAIIRSLILAFYEEYPEYVNDDTYQKVKDKLDFNNEDKTVTKEEL